MVTLIPVPLVLMVPGYRVSTHPPVEGRPNRVTLPVDDMHDGGTIVPFNGGPGVGGWAFIVKFSDCGDMHPVEFVTV